MMKDSSNDTHRLQSKEKPHFPISIPHQHPHPPIFSSKRKLSDFNDDYSIPRYLLRLHDWPVLVPARYHHRNTLRLELSVRWMILDIPIPLHDEGRALVTNLSRRHHLSKWLLNPRRLWIVVQAPLCQEQRGHHHHRMYPNLNQQLICQAAVSPVRTNQTQVSSICVRRRVRRALTIPEELLMPRSNSFSVPGRNP